MTAPGRGNLWTLDIAATTRLLTIFLAGLQRDTYRTDRQRNPDPHGVSRTLDLGNAKRRPLGCGRSRNHHAEVASLAFERTVATQLRTDCQTHVSWILRDIGAMGGHVRQVTKRLHRRRPLELQTSSLAACLGRQANDSSDEARGSKYQISGCTTAFITAGSRVMYHSIIGAELRAGLEG
jgi:hypothetical protein